MKLLVEGGLHHLCLLCVPDPDLEDGGAGEVAELCLKQLPDGLHKSFLVCVTRM